MENFTFYAPTYFAFGKDTENDTGKYVKRFGGSRVLLHYGGGSVIRSGLLDRVKKSLDGEGVSYVELGGVKPNPRSGLVCNVTMQLFLNACTTPVSITAR